MPRKKSKKLKQLEQKLKLIQKEIARRKKLSSPTTPSKSRRRKSNKSVFEECSLILEKFKKLQYSKAFLEPVDWKQLNIPTYPEIIKRPMDLSTVGRKLNNGSYHTPYDFARDMRLIYQNATTFNKPGTTFHSAATKFAKKLEEEFERKVVDSHETNEFTKKICKVIVTLLRRDDSLAFRSPVNPQVLEIPDYLDVIEQPMDLGTILNKINFYSQFKHFVSDLFLVWDNCCRYNPKENMIHQTALRLREYTQRQLGRFCQADFALWKDDRNDEIQSYEASTMTMQGSKGNQSQTNTNKSNSNAMNVVTETPSHTLQSRELIEATPLSHENDNENDNEMEPESPVHESADIFKQCDEMEDEEEANRMMIAYLFAKEELNTVMYDHLDFHQKEELQRGIQCLDSDHFDPLINMLQSFIPEGEGEDDEVELDVDSIDDTLQVKMYNYMLQAIHQQESERILREGGQAHSTHGAVMMPSAIQHSQSQSSQSMDSNIDMAQLHMGEDVKMDNNETVMVENERENNDVSMAGNESEVMVAIESVSNVVNAFPVSGMAIDESGGNENNDNGMGSDEDVDMMGVSAAEVVVSQSGVSEDIVADIVNVVNEEVSGDTNDNDVTDTEINENVNETENVNMNESGAEQKESESANREEQKVETVEVPTMPVLQADSDDMDKGKEEVKEEVQTVIESESNVIESESVVKNFFSQTNEETVLNDGVGDDVSVSALDALGEIDNNEEENVETPLADDIEF